MSTQIEMPELSSDGEGATLATWLVSVGDRVEKGDVIAELETDKATVELEAPATGTIVAFAVEEGTEGILPGSVLGSLDPDDSSAVAEPALGLDKSAASARKLPSVAVETNPVATPEASSEGVKRLRGATPLARRAALERDLDLSTVTGSGPGGRIVEQDVLRVLASDSVAASRSERVAHFCLRARCSMDAVLEIRAQLNRGLAQEGRETKISVHDFILRAAALALRDVPAANVRFVGEELHVLDRVDISVAVATEAGLRMPVVRDVDRKGLARLANEVRTLAIQAREGSLRPEQVQAGTLTISDLGSYGVETVYPILTPSQACILGVGAAEEQPIVRGGEIAIGRIAAITLVADPCAVDEAVGAQFLAALRERLEEPLGMML